MPSTLEYKENAVSSADTAFRSNFIFKHSLYFKKYIKTGAGINPPPAGLFDSGLRLFSIYALFFLVLKRSISRRMRAATPITM